jgi:hypothetical protein
VEFSFGFTKMGEVRKRTRASQQENRTLSYLLGEASPPVSFESTYLEGGSCTNRLQKVQKHSRTGRSFENIGLVTPPMSASLELDLVKKETLSGLYSESAIAKIWGVAQRALNKVELARLYVVNVLTKM